jgi:uncharacterized RDD family membrane protein YckC
MHTIAVRTAQNVIIEYPVATVLDRILGYLLDLLLLGMFYVFFIFIIAVANEFLTVRGKEYVLMVVSMLPLMLYDFVWEIFYNGQTFGKIVMRTRVVRLDGSQPSLGSYLLRWMFRLIDITLSQGSVAVITILFNGKGQRLGDLAGGTTVIKLQDRTSLQDTILVDVDEAYTLIYPEVKKLDDREIALIREVMTFAGENRKGNATESILQKAKEKIAFKMGVDPKDDAMTFFSTVLHDYNFLHQHV